ncbi:hypothetical protein V6N13_104930 [Hibiscus sabdariffa]
MGEVDSRIYNGDFHLDTRLDGDGSNLLYHIWGTEKVNNSLVNTKLKLIPCICSFTTGRFPCGNVKNLGGNSY